MRIAQISDTHLTHLGGVTNQNFERLVDYLNDVVRPDLVINTGDVVVLSPDYEEDRLTAKELHDRIAAPLHVLPGNHDVGEVGEQAWMGILVDDERVHGFESTFGVSRFAEIDDEFAIVGINSEVLSSGLASEGDQWQWLEQLAPRVAGRPVLLCSHKPLWSPFGEVPGHAIAIATADRERLLELFAASPISMSASGHLHRYIKGATDGVVTVSAPSTAFLASLEGNEGPGLQQLGFVEIVIEDRAMRVGYRSVPGIEERGVWDIPEVMATKERIEAAAAA